MQTSSSARTIPAPAGPLLLGSEAFRRPAFGSNHPLKIIRHAAVLDLAGILGWLDEADFRTCPAAGVEQLLEFHDRDYLEALRGAEATGRVQPDVRSRYHIGTLENPVFPGLFDRAARTVGGSILAAELALAGHTVFHPSGGTHHGRADRACGFCYFNDPVFAILRLLDAGLENVVYVDLDAHHGDGVENAFLADRRVTTISVHEENRWPHSGGRSDPDRRAFNLPVPKHFNDSELAFLMAHAVLPIAGAAEVDALVLCCGADCLAGDPLSTMSLSNVSLWQAVEDLLALDRPTVVLGGGGYNPWTLTRYWAGLWGRILGRTIPESLPPAAVAMLRDMECDLVDEEDIEACWLTRIADEPLGGPVRDSVRSLAGDMAA